MQHPALLPQVAPEPAQALQTWFAQTPLQQSENDWQPCPPVWHEPPSETPASPISHEPFTQAKPVQQSEVPAQAALAPPQATQLPALQMFEQQSAAMVQPWPSSKQPPTQLPV